MKPGTRPALILLAFLLAVQFAGSKGCDISIPDLVPKDAPIAVDGLAVLVVYESSKVSELPKEQLAILTGTEWREAVIAAGGQFRVFDKDTDFVDPASPWKPAIEASADVPGVVVSNKGGYAGPLPKDNAAMTVLVKEWIK